MLQGCTDAKINEAVMQEDPSSGDESIAVEAEVEGVQEDPPSSGEDSKIEVGKKTHPNHNL